MKLFDRVSNFFYWDSLYYLFENWDDNKKERFKSLIKDNKDLVNFTSKKYPYPPLIKALKIHNEDLLDFLLNSEGIDLNNTDAMGDGPIVYLIRNNFSEDVKIKYFKIFIRKGSKLELKNTFDWTPLMEICRWDHNPLLFKIFLENLPIDIKLSKREYKMIEDNKKYLNIFNSFLNRKKFVDSLDD